MVPLIPSEVILSTPGIGIYGLDTQGHVTFLNRITTTLLGYTPAELLGQPMHRISHHSKPDGSPYPEHDCPIYAAFKDGKVHAVYDEVFWTKEGQPFQVEYLSAPIRDKGKVAGALVAFTDRINCPVARKELQAVAHSSRDVSDFVSWCRRQKARREQPV